MYEMNYIDYAIIGFCLVSWFILEVAIYKKLNKRGFGCDRKWYMI